MADYYSCKSQILFGLEDLLNLHERASTTFRRFQDFDPNTQHYSYFRRRKQLPSLDGVNGFEVREVSVRGYLSPNEDYVAAFRVILRKGAEDIGRIGSLHVACDFEERESNQSEEHCDTVGIRIRRGTSYFEYAANGSLVTDDVAYRKAFLGELVTLDVCL
jgi:hypothetical protein